MELVRELVARAAEALAQRIAALNHESVDHAMEDDAVVEGLLALLARPRIGVLDGAFGQPDEVGDRLRRLLLEQPDGEGAFSGVEPCKGAHEGRSYQPSAFGLSLQRSAPITSCNRQSPTPIRIDPPWRLTPDLDALVRGQHADPFRLLGPHIDRHSGHLRVRVLKPGARAIELRLRHPERARRADDQTARGRALRGRCRLRWARSNTASTTGSSSSSNRAKRSSSTTRTASARITTDYELHLFGEGQWLKVHERLGAHLTELADIRGVHFAVWAPNAQRVSVVGDFNGWDGRVHPMRHLLPSGVWELFVPGLDDGRAVQVRDSHRRGPPAAQGRSLRPLLRSPAALGGDRLPHRAATRGVTTGGWRSARGPARG